MPSSAKPHRTFAAQAYHAAPDQYVGAGFLKQDPRFRFGFFLLYLLSARVRPFHGAIDG
jgi:hypothetical protein